MIPRQCLHLLPFSGVFPDRRLGDIETDSSAEPAAAAAAAAVLPLVAGLVSSPAGGGDAVMLAGLCVKSGSQIGEFVPYTSSSNIDKNLAGDDISNI